MTGVGNVAVGSTFEKDLKTTGVGNAVSTWECVI